PQASEALEINSRRKISLCEYSECVTRCRTWATSASNLRVSAAAVMEGLPVRPWQAPDMRAAAPISSAARRSGGLAPPAGRGLTSAHARIDRPPHRPLQGPAAASGRTGQRRLDLPGAAGGGQ